MMMTNVMVRPCFTKNNKNFEFDSRKVLRMTHVGDRNLTESRIYPKAELDRMRNVPSSEVWIDHTTL